ncbi:hypothetical protein N7G274_000190 [Stereocaulon virgatum]|uniref:F-box domain-containing protein n=1 Tax=Stereocaulon virgatum TaxID=373712 RepID=A0ABR4ARZ2_9LECA
MTCQDISRRAHGVIVCLQQRQQFILRAGPSHNVSVKIGQVSTFANVKWSSCQCAACTSCLNLLETSSNVSTGLQPPSMADPSMMANMFDRNVRPHKQEIGSSALPLPLNLIGLIISYLDSSADLSRMLRTCRVFHYMTLPQLYINVSLRSYDTIRYCGREGRAQGCGMASPFSMALNGLVSRNVAGYVRNFEVTGQWKEHDVLEHSRVGRVPDESMMLNTLVRVAVEKMVVLDSFSWNLNTKMLPTLWQGLAQKSTLTKLTIQFPSNRHPRPITIAPPIPSLHALKITEIDPLCYVDDISGLLAGAKNLKDLKLHWSSRMREAREPSVHPAAYFGKLHTPLSLRSIAVVNLYTQLDCRNCRVFEQAALQEVTFLNSMSGLGDDGGTVFMDDGWAKCDDHVPTQLKMLRVDKVSRQQCEVLAHINSLERLYLIGPHLQPRRGKDYCNSTIPLPHSPPSSTASPTSIDNNAMTLKDEYLETITKHHGRTLKHLLLLPQWRLTDDDIALVVRQCPNLEQLGMGADFSTFKQLRLLVPFLTNLTCLRLLSSPDDPTFVNQMRELEEQGVHEKKIAEETVNQQRSALRFIEIGAEDLIFEIGARAPVEKEGMKTIWKRKVRKRPFDVVRDIDIWKLDSLDI